MKHEQCGPRGPPVLVSITVSPTAKHVPYGSFGDADWGVPVRTPVSSQDQMPRLAQGTDTSLGPGYLEERNFTTQILTRVHTLQASS